MLFNSLTFVAFFALVLALHHGPFSWKSKKRNLLIGSVSRGILKDADIPVLLVPIRRDGE